MNILRGILDADDVRLILTLLVVVLAVGVGLIIVAALLGVALAVFEAARAVF